MTVTIHELPTANVEDEERERGSEEEDHFFDAHSDAGSESHVDEDSVQCENASASGAPSEGCRSSGGPPSCAQESAGEGEEWHAGSAGASTDIPPTFPATCDEVKERLVEMPGGSPQESGSEQGVEEGAAADGEEEGGGEHFGERVETEGGSEIAPADEGEVSEEEKQRMLLASEALKQEGNTLFGQQQFREASQKYTEAIMAGPPRSPELAIYYANRAACLMKLELWKDAVDDCNNALKLKEGYIKALLRRCASYEKMDELESALSDANKVVELEPANREAAAIANRLQPIVEERREKLKEEMMGKLKDLGNMVLGKFGMSLDNFQAVQDPATGGYSINFKQ